MEFLFRILERLWNWEPKDWIAVYAAFLSTITAIVQITNTFRQSPRLRVRCWWERPSSKREPDVRYFVLRVANVGHKPMKIFPPHLQVANNSHYYNRIHSKSPSDVENGYDWAPLDDPRESDDAFELKDMDAISYRFTLDSATKILAIRVADGAGVLRYRRRLFLAPVHCLVFYLRRMYRLVFSPKKQPKRKSAA
jgi:hypothetical protein